MAVTIRTNLAFANQSLADRFGSVLACGERGGGPVTDMRSAWRRLCMRAGLGRYVCRTCDKDATGKKCSKCGHACKYDGLIPHDLRRSAAKAGRRSGVPESVIMAVGGWRLKRLELTAHALRGPARIRTWDQGIMSSKPGGRD